MIYELYETLLFSLFCSSKLLGRSEIVANVRSINATENIWLLFCLTGFAVQQFIIFEKLIMYRFSLFFVEAYSNPSPALKSDDAS